MKKVIVMAIALMASAMTFAGDSEALKAITKTKNYAEAVKLVESTLGQLADDSERAKAYNHLVDLAMNRVQEQTGIAAENVAAAATGGKVKPYDTLALADGICDAMEQAYKCDVYDQKPNAKGKIAPRYAKKNAERIWAVRQNLIRIGQDEGAKNNDKGVVRYWGSYADSHANDFFKSQDHKDSDKVFGQVAFWAGRYAIQLGEFDKAQHYMEIALADPEQKAEAQRYHLFAMQKALKTAEDSVAYGNKLKALYESDPENELYFASLNQYYEVRRDKAAQNAFLDAHLAKNPQSTLALNARGTAQFYAGTLDDGIATLNKSIAIKETPEAYAYLGMCYATKGNQSEQEDQRKAFFEQAVKAFDKAKELDPKKERVNWGANRSQVYYALYGANDPRTQAAEADR